MALTPNSPTVTPKGVAEIESILGLNDYTGRAMLGIEKDGVQINAYAGVETAVVHVTLVGRLSLGDARRIQDILVKGDV